MEKSLLQKISIALFLVLLPASVVAAGGYAGVVQQMPLSAVAIGRGGASTANPDFGMAFWNAARAGAHDRFSLSLGGAVLPLGRGEGFVAGEGRFRRTRLGLSGALYYRGISDLGTQYFDDKTAISGEDFISITSKFGLGFAVSKTFSLGLSLGWLYGSMPVDYRDEAVVRAKRSSIGAVSLLGSWELENGTILAAGVKDLLSSEVWNETGNSGGYSLTLSDTSASPFVGAVSHEWIVSGQTIRIDSDLNLWVINSYFGALDHPFSTWNNGVTWGLNNTLDFRIGVRNFLLTNSMFNDAELYKLESSPRFSGGLGLDFGNRLKFADMSVNYALSGTGSGAGIDHYFDFLFEF